VLKAQDAKALAAPAAADGLSSRHGMWRVDCQGRAAGSRKGR